MKTVVVLNREVGPARPVPAAETVARGGARPPADAALDEAREAELKERTRSSLPVAVDTPRRSR